MSTNEAKARLKINELLTESGWRLTSKNNLPANIIVEQITDLPDANPASAGDDYESTSKGFIDYLPLDEKGMPVAVLEAKSEKKNPLDGKEQARQYAKGQKCRFVILSNGNHHYFWDLEAGNPNPVAQLPSLEMLQSRLQYEPDSLSLTKEKIAADYIVTTQYPDYAKDPGYVNEKTRPRLLMERKLRFLRPYQIAAIQAIQYAVSEGKDRFLLEMATGTGKTLTAAAILKLFLRTKNARRILFLVDRLELESQAEKDFKTYLRPDFKTIIYKEKQNDWRMAEIVVTTVQSLTFKNKYKRLFAPSDFDLVISDETHRSITGQSRGVFDYFIGFKLGLTATPKDYLRNFHVENARKNEPRQLERRNLYDTYRTFGCLSGEPTFRYTLLDGVKDGFLINPVVVDARTEITTQLLSDKGYTISTKNEAGEDLEENFSGSDFENKFFSEETNKVFAQTLMQHGLRDPVTGEFGKTIVFCVSQDHAARMTQHLNKLADQYYPGKYQSDFAMQVTSRVTGAQQMTINFTNNNLGGKGVFNNAYNTGKTRICVTVGMMTTGYDCPDILNLALMRPVMSPSEFIQIKGRGTRRHSFAEQAIDDKLKAQIGDAKKEKFKLFDFFAVCEYFEEKFPYDEVLQLPTLGAKGGPMLPPQPREGFENKQVDPLAKLQEHQVGLEGMYVDRFIAGETDDDKYRAAEEAFEAFDERFRPNEEDFDTVRSFFLSYACDEDLRRIIDSGEFALLNTHPNGEYFMQLKPEYRKQIPDYVRNYVQNRN